MDGCACRFEMTAPVEELEPAGMALPQASLQLLGSRSVVPEGGITSLFLRNRVGMIFRFADLSAVEPWNRIALRDDYASAHEWALNQEDEVRGVERKVFATAVCKGVELVFASGKGWGRERICVVEDRLYSLTVVGSRRQVFGGAGKRFFESFEATPQ